MTQEQLIKIKEVKSLLRTIKKSKKKLIGGSFNIFSIMDKETDEVHTHSAVIAELLNPEGSHGNGDLYLQLFLQTIPELREMEFDTTKAKVKIEHIIGDIKNKKTEGGRIDILIKSGDKAIIIENKIHAEDQPKQLLRYNNYAVSQNYSQYHILYLTLGGKAASRSSLCDMPKDYVRISYKNHIANWLKECLENSVMTSAVREVVLQYFDLIVSLTTKKSEHQQIIDLVDLCKNADDLIELKKKFGKDFDSILSCAIRNKFFPQLESLASNYQLELFENGYDWNHKHKAFSFRRTDWKTFEITFLFEKEEFINMRCGFRYITKQDGGYPNIDTYRVLANIEDGKTEDRWPYYRKCENYANWKKGSIITSIYDEKDGLIKKIEKDLNNLLRIAENLPQNCKL